MRALILTTIAFAGCADDPHLPITGTYTTHTELVVAPLKDATALLHELQASPGQAILDAAKMAGVPVVDDVPDILQSHLAGWISDAIGQGARDTAGDVADLVDVTLGSAELDSTLVFDGLTVEHRITALEIADQSLVIPGDAPDLIVTADADAYLQGSTVVIGDHAFGLPYGELALRALDAAAQQRWHHSIPELIAAAINCPSVAQSVASQCMFGECVGHADSLDAACAAGVAELAGELHDQVANLRFDVLRLSSGRAQMSDDRTTISEGAWAATANLGIADLDVDAPFTAQLVLAQ